MAKAAFEYRPMRAYGRPATQAIRPSAEKHGVDSRVARPKTAEQPCHTAVASYDIKAALKRCGLSRARAAALIGVWKSTVDDWCAGTSVPKYACIILDLIEHCPPARERLEALLDNPTPVCGGTTQE
jgi:DNA-binding transcriptional regulator YiaG